MDNTFLLGIKILDPEEEVLEILKEINTKSVDEGEVFPYEESQLDLYDELSDLEGKLSLGVFNKNDKMFYDSKKLTKTLADEAEAEEEDLDLGYLPDLGNFIDENSVSIEEEIEKIQTTYYANLEIETEKEDKSQEEVNTSDISEEDALKKFLKSSVSEDDKNQSLEEENRTRELPQGKVDTLLQLSADIFDSKVDLTLPIYDEYTRKQLQSQIVHLETSLNEKREKAILGIYDVLNGFKDKFEKDFENKFSQSTEVHKKTLGILNNNEQEEIDRTIAKFNDDYEIAQTKFVEAREKSIRDEYDSQYRASFNENVKTAIKKIKDSIEEKVDHENKNFLAHKQQEEQKYVEREMKNIDFSEVIQTFKNLAQVEKENLEKEAREFADQVALITADVTKERDDIRQRLEGYQNENKLLSEKFENKVTVETDKKVVEATNSLMEKYSQISKSYSEVVRSLDSEREKNELLKKMVNKKKGIEREFGEDKENSKSDIEEKKVQKKSGNNFLLAGVAGVAVIIITVSFIGINFLSSRASSDNNIVREESSSSTQSNRNSSSNTQSNSNNSSSTAQATSTEKYSKGDTWTYHNSSDNKDYEVTMDNDSTGHYTDAQGQQHNIQLSTN